MSVLMKLSFCSVSYNTLNALKTFNVHSFKFCNFCKISLKYPSNQRSFHSITLLAQFKPIPRNNFRLISTKQNDLIKRRTILNYIIATGLFCAAMAYAAVPLYRIFCASYSYGGTVAISESGDKIATMKPDLNRKITVKFNADIGSTMRWNFKPQQISITVRPGETALAFYTALNPSNVPITGISSYNVLPYEAGQYFVKIQCFCFEEQQLNPHEQVDMPVFFYIDPEYASDPKLELIDEITLSYTFFEAKEASKLLQIIPSYVKQHSSPQSNLTTS